MPKNVDHEERRREYQTAAMRVILREGLEAVTTRAVAREAGYSNGVLSHYFPDKDSMMRAVIRSSHARIIGRWNSKLEGLRGIKAVQELLLDNLPLDAEREAETRLEISLWGRALVSQPLRALHDGEASEVRRRLLGHLKEAQADGELHPNINLSMTLERLLALMDGLSVRMLVGPKALTAAKARAVLIDEVHSLRESRSGEDPHRGGSGE